jgi:hypothetical protein
MSERLWCSRFPKDIIVQGLHYPLTWSRRTRLTRVVYTTDRPWSHPKALWKYVDWLLDSSRDHFGLHQGENIEWLWSSRFPKDIIVQGMHYPLTWSNGFCGGRGERGALVGEREKKAHDRAMLLWYKLNEIVLWGQEKMKPKRRQENSHT